MKKIFDSKFVCGQFIVPQKEIVKVKSKYQNIKVIYNEFYGKILILDDYFQISENDEFLYHEALVHFPLFAHPCPRSVLIIGGGDGGALEEVLKHDTITKVVQVELDPMVTEISKIYFSKVNKHKFDDSRVNLFFEDGFNYLEKNTDLFDIILIDLTDPNDLSKKLYSLEFYLLVKKHLTNGGIVSLHIESPVYMPKLFGNILYTLKSVFKEIKIHDNYVPLYGGTIYFALCSNKIKFDKINKEVKERFKKRKINNLNYFSPNIYNASFIIPNYILNIIKSNKKLIKKGKL